MKDGSRIATRLKKETQLKEAVGLNNISDVGRGWQKYAGWVLGRAADGATYWAGQI